MILQPPQLSWLVMISMQLAPQARRSDGQTRALVIAGGLEDSVTLVISGVITGTGVVVSGREVTLITFDGAVGVTRRVIAGATGGMYLRVPDACRKYSAARITIIAIAAMAIILILLFWPGCAVGET